MIFYQFVFILIQNWDQAGPKIIEVSLNFSVSFKQNIETRARFVIKTINNTKTVNLQDLE